MSKYFHSKVEITKAYGVSPQTLQNWTNKSSFPRKDGRANGWSKSKVAEWVKKHNEEHAGRVNPGVGDRAEKTKLECERLRVVIKKEEEALRSMEIDTAEKEGKLANVVEVERKYRAKAEALRGVVEGWRAHNIAKHPSMADVIDGLADDFVRMVADG